VVRPMAVRSSRPTWLRYLRATWARSSFGRSACSASATSNSPRCSIRFMPPGCRRGFLRLRPWTTLLRRLRQWLPSTLWEAYERSRAFDLADLGTEQAKFVRHVRGRFDAADGRFIKFTGDGCVAAFESPVTALLFVREVAVGVRSAGYDLRVGLHLGRVEVVADQPVGAAALITHELLRKAEPGSVLISRSAGDVLRTYGVEVEDGSLLSLASARERWQTYTWPIERKLDAP
jgi:hypothetical protein